MNSDLLGQISSALQQTYDPSTSHSVRQSCLEFLEHVKQLPNAAELGGELCKNFGSGNLGTYLRNFGLLLMEETVKYRWNLLEQAAKGQLKKELEELFQTFMPETQSVRTKYSRIVARVAAREWPQQWAPFTDLLIGPGSSAAQPDSFSLVCMIFGDLCDEVFSEANACKYFYIEEERKLELIRAISLVAERLLPQIMSIYPRIVDDLNSEKNSSFCKVVLSLFISYFPFCSATLLMQDAVFVNATFSLLLNSLSNDIILSLTVELFELICSKNYEFDENSHLSVFLLHLQELSRFCQQLCSGDAFKRTIFIRIVYSLAELGTKQICNTKSPLKGAEIGRFVDFLFGICDMDLIQAHAIVAPFWPALLKHAHWSKNSSLIQGVCAKVLQIVLAFFPIDHAKCFEKSKSFVDNELSFVDFERFYSKAFVIYSDTIRCITKRLPDEICNFCLPPILQLLEAQDWHKANEQKMDALLLVFENVVKGLIAMRQDEFSLIQISQYFIFMLTQLCQMNFTEAESIYFQLYSIGNCLKFIMHFTVEFQFSTLYTKLFHLIYEFQDTNSFYKSRVKEKLFNVLFSVASRITLQDAVVFIQYGLQISNSGYIFPEMNTVLVDFMLSLATDLLSSPSGQEAAALRNQVFELCYAHIRDASQRIRLNLSPVQFMNLIGLYLALKRYQSAGKKGPTTKFLEGDLQPCSELSWNISKLNVLISKITTKREALPSPFAVQCVYACLSSVFELVGFLHQMAEHDKDFNELYLFSIPFHSKTLLSNANAARTQTSESTLESFFNRFSNWYTTTCKTCYSLIAAAMEFVWFYEDENILASFFNIFAKSIQYDFYFIQGILDSLIDPFIRKIPPGAFIHLFSTRLCPTLVKLTEKCSQEWMAIRASDDVNLDDEADDDLQSIRLKILTNCCKKLLSIWMALLERMDEFPEGILQLFFLFSTFKSDGLIVRSLEFLLAFMAKCKQRPNFYSLVNQHFNALMQRMLEVVVAVEDDAARQGMFSQLAQFVLECINYIDFFTWIQSKSSNLIIPIGQQRFMQKSSQKGRRDIIRDVLKGCFDAKLDEQESSKFKIKNLQEKLILTKQETEPVEFENDYNLNLLFE